MRYAATILALCLIAGGLWAGRKQAREADQKPAPGAAARRPLGLVCFGDSITGHRPRQPYQHAYLKFSDLLGLMLEARRGLGNAVVLNRGYTADRTFKHGDKPGAVNRLRRDVLEEKPHIAVVLIGGNDTLKTREDRARTRKNLQSIFGRLKQAGIRVLALKYHVLVNPESPEKAWVHLHDANDLVAEAAAAHGLPVLDMGRVMREAAKHHPLGELVSPADGVHLAPRGEMAYARAIFAKLDELGWLQVPAGPAD